MMCSSTFCTQYKLERHSESAELCHTMPYLTVLRRWKNNLCVRPVIWIRSSGFLAHASPFQPENRVSSGSAIVLTDQQTKPRITMLIISFWYNLLYKSSINLIFFFIALMRLCKYYHYDVHSVWSLYSGFAAKVHYEVWNRITIEHQCLLLRRRHSIT